MGRNKIENSNLVIFSFIEYDNLREQREWERDRETEK